MTTNSPMAISRGKMRPRLRRGARGCDDECDMEYLKGALPIQSRLIEAHYKYNAKPAVGVFASSPHKSAITGRDNCTPQSISIK